MHTHTHFVFNQSPFPDEVPIPIPPPLQSALERDSCLITQHGKVSDYQYNFIIYMYISIGTIFHHNCSSLVGGLTPATKCWDNSQGLLQSLCFWSHWWDQVSIQLLFIVTWSKTSLFSLSLLIEVLDGVKVYFDFMLADHLLYLEEQQQYREKMVNNGKTESHHLAPGVQEVVLATPPSTVYGVEHLLRLFGMWVCWSQLILHTSYTSSEDANVPLKGQTTTSTHFTSLSVL